MSYEDWVKQQVEASLKVQVDDPLGVAMKHAEKVGYWMEFGVYEGNTLRRLAAERGQARVYGFDSFKGLPSNGPNGWIKGMFATDRIPQVEGAEIVVGLFEDALPGFKWAMPVTLVHVDCDLYAAARCALQNVRPHLAVGAMIAWDEIFQYEGFEGQELRALYETHLEGLKFEWVCRWNEHAAIRVIESGTKQT
jgi:hypothetical protein